MSVKLRVSEETLVDKVSFCSTAELQGCEDAWISPEHGVAYLFVSSLSPRSSRARLTS